MINSISLSEETKKFIREHRSDDVRQLALQASKNPKVDVPVAVVQIAGRQTAVEKLPTWSKCDDLIYPRHISLEQCSSEFTARYKASLIEGDTFVDLTAGFGIDCAFISEKFKQATYIEQQEELCEIARHNFPLLGLNHIDVVHTNGIEYLKTMAPVDGLFIDPARRNEHGGKTIAISDCEPDVEALEDVLVAKAKCVMIKLSPMLDLSLALKAMKQTSAFHIVSVNNECKELILVLHREITQQPVEIHCVNITGKGEQHFALTRESEQTSECEFTSTVEDYLYEPNASVLKAGAYRSVASAFNVKKLHPNSHLYTSKVLVPEFPGRIFKVDGQCSLNKNEIKKCLNTINKANLTVRNFPTSVAELRKRLKLNEGGSIYLFATTLHNEQKILIRCERVTL